MTLADVIITINADQRMEPSRRHECSSALRSLCRVLGKDPSFVIADPAALRRRMKELGPTVAGYSRGRWRNIKSLAMKALAAAGIEVTPARSSNPLTPAWRELFDRVKDQTTRLGLSRFVRWCDNADIAPAAVSDSVMNDFAEFLLREGVTGRPKSAHRNACQQWNRAVATVSGWPATTLAVPDYRRAVALPDETFPAAFIAERDVFLKDYSGVDRLASTDRLARLRKRKRRDITVQHRRYQIMQFAGALVRRGHAAESMTLRYIVDHAEDALRFFLDRLPPGETSGQVGQLAVALKIIGDYLKVGEEQKETLRDYCRGLAPDNGGISEKREVRLQQFDDPQNLLDLLLLPQQIYRELVGKKELTLADAVAMAMAVAIELFFMKPMRISTLASINAEMQISRTRPGRGGVTHIAVSNSQVKNSVRFSLALPECSAELLRFYLERCLPLLSHGTPWLFPRNEGNHKRSGALGGQIQRFIKRHTGLTVNPHLFRSIAAIIILHRNPGAYEDVAQVLGTKTLAIVIKHYCREETKAALKRYDEMILELRGQVDGKQKPRNGR
jgi:hypothetical protein